MLGEKCEGTVVTVRLGYAAGFQEAKQVQMAIDCETFCLHARAEDLGLHFFVSSLTTVFTLVEIDGQVYELERYTMQRDDGVFYLASVEYVHEPSGKQLLVTA